jgi:predicted nucleic acid-binding protein
MKPMSAEAFLDTNVFVYCFDPSDPGKQQRALKLIESAVRDGMAVISTQVMQEFLNIATPNSRQRSKKTISDCIWMRS